MENYKVLPLKWRPKSFEDFVGNENIIKVILNSLIKKKIYNTYLFYGQRGVGKTSLCRLLSKSLNCINNNNNDNYFCSKCINCISIDKGKSLDVYEIDGASKSKIEDIKDILDNIYYLPVSMRYKIYIIDEVHMLSRYSFNSLLKILEEPPKYVKFILATTEFKKIPNTILSRCMSFYLKPLSVNNILSRLVLVSDNESFSYDIDALKQISINSNGSLRDALILLDQLSLVNNNIKLKYVNYFLNIINDKYIFGFLSSLFLKNYNKIFYYLYYFINKNIDYENVLSSIIDKLYKLLLIKIIKNIDYKMFDINNFNKLNILNLSNLVSKKCIKYYYELFFFGFINLVNSYNKKMFFEYLIIKSIFYK